MEEIWKDIQGYPNYQISNMGNVKSLNYRCTGKEKILKPAKNKDGYFYVGLCKQGKVKTYKIHRLVAETFIDNPNNLPQVNHRNEIKTDNRTSNLEWCTAKQNINYGTRNQRSAEKLSKQVLCLETGKIYPSTIEVQRDLGFVQSDISMCCRGKLKTCGGLHWRYVE